MRTTGVTPTVGAWSYGGPREAGVDHTHEQGHHAEPDHEHREPPDPPRREASDDGGRDARHGDQQEREQPRADRRGALGEGDERHSAYRPIAARLTGA
jgi:hypothetical protein